MSASAPPVQVDARRFVTADGTLVEPIFQPLYSTFALDNAALPQEIQFFGYAVGGVVPGAGNFAGATAGVPAATIWHTNLEIPNQLPAPKRFTIMGVRIFLPHFVSTGGAATPAKWDTEFGAAVTDGEALEDWLGILYSGHFRLRIGEKYYADCPLFNVPANTGFSGVAGISADNGSAATISSLEVLLPMHVGIGLCFPVYPVLIESAQSFGAVVTFPWATNVTLNDDRAIVCVLDGKLTREVQ